MTPPQEYSQEVNWRSVCASRAFPTLAELRPRSEDDKVDDASSSDSSSFLPLESASEADGDPHRIGGGRGCACENPFLLWLRATAARTEGEGELKELLKEEPNSDSPSSDSERAFGSLSTGVEEGEGGYLKERFATRGVTGGCI